MYFQMLIQMLTQTDLFTFSGTVLCFSICFFPPARMRGFYDLVSLADKEGMLFELKTLQMVHYSTPLMNSVTLSVYLEV